MQKIDRAIETFGKPILVKKLITTCLVVSGSRRCDSGFFSRAPAGAGTGSS